MMDISKLVTNEAAWLAKQEARTRQKLINLYKESFAEMEAKLKSQKRDSYSRRHTRAIAAQLDAILQETSDRQADVLGKDVQLTFEKQLFRERDAWSELEKAFGTVKAAHQFEAIQPAVTGRAVKPLLAAQQVAIKGFNSDLSKAVRNEVAKSMLAGEGMKKTTRRLKQIKDAPKNEARLHLISRMEHARASNAGKQEFIQQVNQEHPGLELWQMIKGRVDTSPKTRNHWFTWAINGTVRNVTKDEYFEVHHAAIAQAKIDYTTKTHRKASDSGILWKKFDKGRRSKKIPSHFHDRDVIVAWRPSWGTVAGPVKHPQAPIGEVEKPFKQNSEPKMQAEPQNEKSAPADVSKEAVQRVRKRKLDKIVFEQPRPGFDYQALEFEDDFKDFIDKYQVKGSLINKRPQLKLFEFEKRFLGLPHERGVLFNDVGAQLYAKNGFFDELPFDWDELKPYRNQRFTHYHPLAIGFSDMDIINAIVCNFKELRVICPYEDGYCLFSIERKGGAWKKLWNQSWKWSPEDLLKLHNTYNINLLEKQNELTDAGLDPVMVKFQSTDYAVSQACKLMNVQYRKIKLNDL